MREGNWAEFSFLTHEEFRRLSNTQKAFYLLRAQQELEVQRNNLREQRKELARAVEAVSG